jgi:glycosyltransferase involved in cell wall biosynthesis
MRERISACVTTFNEEKKVARCLGSLTSFDEIVVVDSFSEDRTAAICRQFTPRVYQHPWLGYVSQKNLVCSLASHPWMLIVDADEEVSPELKDEILDQAERGHGAIVGYRFPRMTRYLGAWIRHGDWYPDTKLRLFRRVCGKVVGQEPHDRVSVQGRVKDLHGCIRHFPFDDLSAHLDTMNRYAQISAAAKFDEGLRCRWVDLSFRPLWRMIRCYLVKRGYRDGTRGFLIAALCAYGTFSKYAKLWEMTRGAEVRVRARIPRFSPKAIPVGESRPLPAEPLVGIQQGKTDADLLRPVPPTVT